MQESSLTGRKGVVLNVLACRKRKTHFHLHAQFNAFFQSSSLCADPDKNPKQEVPLSAVLPAIMEVELRREAGGLSNRALLGSSWCRLGGCWCRKAGRCLACLGWYLAGLDECLTCLSDRLARLGASLARLGYRAWLGLGAVFLGQWALLL